MSRDQNAEPRHEARDLWRAAHKTGEPATFRPGDELRCPGLLRIPGYAGICGCSFSGERTKPHTRVIIRVRNSQALPSPHPGTDLRCHKCYTWLEKLVIGEATE